MKDDHTLVITRHAMTVHHSAASDPTYFGKAFFEQLSNPRGGFVEALTRAREAISAREKLEKLEPAEPQVATAKNEPRLAIL
ncbi:MAG: hypothetical protein AB1513_00605 [Pseudomonadota bacterium]